ncbi:MAG: FtsW/RodA/SpoVE family cell cycle protein [Microvirga sp.]
MMSRAERSLVGDWWWTVDRATLAGLVILMVAGLVLLMAGGPPVAERLGLSTFHFVSRQVLYLAPAVALMVAVSFLSLRHVRRLALLSYLIGMALVAAALQWGPEIKGAHRWISVAGIGLQPSEFVKPAFVVLAAWAFAEGARKRDMPGAFLALLLLPATIVPLILQPDFGQTMLITVVWCGLFFVAGLHWFWVVGLGGAGAVGIVAAYRFLPHVRDRIERFLHKVTGDGGGKADGAKSVIDNFQTETAMEAFVRGGWFGSGPGEGIAKRRLPDAHTDFIFAVTGEEFGIIVCLALLALFAFIVLRGLFLAQRNEDTFCRLASTGLVMMFGLQAAINMAVNVQLMPAKGMTLPFISYGGSSLISLALGMGFLMALTRRRPRAEMAERLGSRA